jgi:hypothetical protein
MRELSAEPPPSAGRTGEHPLGERLRVNAARTARPCGEALLELTFQAFGREAVFRLDLDRDLDPDPRGLEAYDVHVVGPVLPVRMVIALTLFKRVFARSLPMNQAHGSHYR